jgi:hypothetical protein
MPGIGSQPSLSAGMDASIAERDRTEFSLCDLRAFDRDF